MAENQEPATITSLQAVTELQESDFQEGMNYRLEIGIIGDVRVIMNVA